MCVRKVAYKNCSEKSLGKQMVSVPKHGVKTVYIQSLFRACVSTSNAFSSGTLEARCMEQTHRGMASLLPPFCQAFIQPLTVERPTIAVSRFPWCLTLSDCVGQTSTYKDISFSSLSFTQRFPLASFPFISPLFVPLETYQG